MVNPGRPSGRCASCKKRKIKCDELRPGCSQCSKSGWICPGYLHKIEINFRNETQSVIEKALKGKAGLRADSPAPRSNRKIPRPISPGLTDQGIAFFLHQYVSSGANEVESMTRGNHEYLPKLLGDGGSVGMPDNSARMALKTITAAAGLAGLANSSSAQTLVPEAYKLYGTAIRQIRDALQDDLQVHLDEALATVMLMGTFETITSADKESLKSFSYHTTAAAKLIEERGSQQFKTEEAVRLFHQLRRLIVMTTHQMQEAIPYALVKWSQWASPAQRADESNANRFGEINGQLAALRAAIKHRKITNPSTVVSMLLPIDNELEYWKSELPENWSPTLHSLSQDGGYQAISDDLDSQFETYPDLWVASMWNNYRTVRILIYETIMSITLKYGTSEEIAALQPTIDVLREMTTQVCRSVAFHLGTHPTRTSTNSDLGDEKWINGAAIPGGYILAWPLYLAGMLRTTPREQKMWMASQLQRIAVTMGLRLAHSFAETLRLPIEKSFSDTEVWFIGEFLPQ